MKNRMITTYFNKLKYERLRLFGATALIGLSFLWPTWICIADSPLYHSSSQGGHDEKKQRRVSSIHSDDSQTEDSSHSEDSEKSSSTDSDDSDETENVTHTPPQWRQH